MGVIMENQYNANELDELFQKCMEEFKQLSIETKCQKAVESLKELTVFIDLLSKNSGIKLGYLKNREVLDLKKENTTIDDYLEAIMVYVENVKNMLGQFIEQNGYKDN